MKKIPMILVAGFCFLITATVFGQTIPVGKVEAASIPSNVDEFTTLRNSIATTPQGGAAAFIIALKMYAENPTEGTKALIVALDQSRLSQSSSASSYKGYAIGNSDSYLLGQITKAKYIANSYFAGSSPENSYTASAPFVMDFFSGKYSGDPASGTTKLFVTCTGADSRRPITVKKNDKGVWKVSEYSSLVVGIRKPGGKPKDDL